MTLNEKIMLEEIKKLAETFRLTYIFISKERICLIRKGFDNDKYLSEQTAAILERVNKFDNKLYLEFAAKFFWIIMPRACFRGFDLRQDAPFENLKNEAILSFAFTPAISSAARFARISASPTMSMPWNSSDDLRDWGINILAVVITRYEIKPSATIFKNKLERQGIKVYTHRFTKGYPTDVD